MWLYVIDTSRRTDYGLVALATVLTGALSVWVAWESGWNPGTAVLLALTVVLAGASAYARRLWEKDRANMESRRVRAANLRAFR